MTTRDGLLKAAEICEALKVEWLRGNATHSISDFDACAKAIRAIAAQEPEPEGWKRYEVTYEMPSEHYGDHVFKRDFDGHWFRLKLPELPTERTAVQETSWGSVTEARNASIGDKPALAVPPAPMPGKPEQWKLICTALPQEFVTYAAALRTHAEALQREIKYLRACISGKGGYIEVMTARDDEFAALRPVVDHLRWILPMAKGYAAEHNVGRNQEIVNNAESSLAAIDKRGEGKS